MSDSFRSREELEHVVVLAHARGSSIRELSATLKISRNTVRRILRAHRRRCEQGHDVLPVKRAPRGRKLDAHVETMRKLLDEFPDIKGQRMLEELRQAGYDGGITQVRERLQELRPHPKHEPTVRFETAPGKQGQFDWSPYKVKLRSGQRLAVLCFSYILGFSRRHYIDFTPRRDFYTLIRRHVDTFTYFQGVPEECLYDGEKTVLLRWEGQQPIFNPAFLSFITHYRCRPVACRKGRAQTKGKIEKPFQYVESSLLNARKFVDLEDLRQTARWWMAHRSDPHKHDTTGRPPLELFLEQEAAALQALPANPYDTGEVGYRVCGYDGFVEWGTNRYSVDYQHVGDILAVKVTEHEVIVYGPDLHVVARHARKPDGSRAVEELPEHRRDPKVRYGLAPVRESFEALGAHAAEYLAGLAQRHPRNGGFHARRILLLRERYHSDDIDRALAHALRYLAYDALAVERIVRAKARPRTLEETANDRARERLRSDLPPVPQRPLSEYERALRPRPSGQSHDEEE